MDLAVKRLNELCPGDVDLFGGKALALSVLSKKGFSVPDGFCLPKTAFDSFLVHNSINRWAEEELAGKITAGDMPGDVREALMPAWKTLSTQKEASLVVRSSAIEEDGRDHSFAGIYESILNARSLENVTESVKRCWSSSYSEKAVQYRKRNCLTAEGMGIILQNMVQGEKSGVLFTMNPVNFSKAEIIIEAYPGLNCALLGGTELADRFVVNRLGELRAKTIGIKKNYYCLSPYPFQIDIRNLKKELWDQPSLSPEEILKLTKVGVSIEKIWGMPCDIEWTIAEGKIHILQCRPITARNREKTMEDIYFDMDIPENSECSLLDRYSEPACTCYLSLLESWEGMVYLSFYHKLPGSYYTQKPLLFFFNRVYWNLKYQRDFFNDLPFGGRGIKNFLKRIRLIMLFFTGARSWYHRIGKYERVLAGASQKKFSGMGIAELTSSLKGVIENFCGYFGIDHFRFLGLAQVSYGMLTRNFSGIDNYKGMIADLVETKALKNMTVRSNTELLSLIQEVEKNRKAREIFSSFSPAEIYEALAEAGEDRFLHRFNRFITQHGHRGTSCDDLYSSHWAEEPALVLDLIKQFLLGANRGFVEFDSGIKKTPIEKEKLIDRYVNTKGAGLISRFWERIKIKLIVNWASEYMALRENQRYYFDKSWLIIRKIILEIGNILVRQKILQDSTDIFHLRIDEIYQLNNRPNENSAANLNELAGRRKKVYERNSKITPPYLIKNSEFINLQKKGKYKSYKAVGISPGKTMGPARIIVSFKDLSRVKEGDIVIVSNFHPSWTPILAIVNGLVMNYGNILSHGAVVAREYRIPVVVFNDMATKVFEENQWIEIDGTTGRIKIPEVYLEDREKREATSR